MNAICLVLDRLQSGYVGPYGNCWIETPQWDRLASQSLVFDQVLVDSPCLELLYRSLWQGRHAQCQPNPGAPPAALPDLLAAGGVRPFQLSDEAAVLAHPLAAGFEERLQMPPARPGPRAEALDETHLAACFSQLIQWLQTPPERPFLLWCHLASLGTAWDAPLDFRQQYVDEGDPAPSTSSEVPSRLLPRDYDPDEVLPAAQAYAGQVTLLDACLGAFLESLDETRLAEDTLLAVMSARGMFLGEHNRLGPCDDAIYSSTVHVPLMVRLPDGAGAAARSQALVEPADLWATLLDWFSILSPSGRSLLPVIRGDADRLRDRLIVVGRKDRAIRTPVWYLRSAETDELFVKPDDRWEINDVADRCHDLAGTLRAALDQTCLALESGDLAGVPPLGEELLHEP